jgi:hypothetical protein
VGFVKKLTQLLLTLLLGLAVEFIRKEGNVFKPAVAGE